MSMNNNNQVKNVGVSPHFGNSGLVPQPMSLNPQPHLLSQAQPQTQSGSHFPVHFQLSEPQAQALAQSQFVTVHMQVQAYAAHAKFQAQLQSQAHPLAQLHSANANNAGVSSPPVVTPGAGSAKRAYQKPPSRLPSSSNANTSSPFQTMELTPAAQRKKRKLSDKLMPDKIASLLPKSALYTHLLELEAQVDAALARKKIDIQESFKISPRFQKTLRIYVFNTFANQTQSTPGNKDADPPTWSLKIFGRLLEDGKDPAVSGMTLKWSTKFSSFFKNITIYLDQNLYPDNHGILWEISRSPVLHNSFEVKQKGIKNSLQ